MSSTLASMLFLLGNTDLNLIEPLKISNSMKSPTDKVVRQSDLELPMELCNIPSVRFYKVLLIELIQVLMML